MDKNTKLKFNILAIVCIILFSCALAPKTLQNDTFYTISIGEHIAEYGVDGEDPFAWNDLKYTYPHWLYDLGIYLIYNIRRNDWYIYFNHCIKCNTWSCALYNKYEN